MENWTFGTNGTANCKSCGKSYTNYFIDKTYLYAHMRSQHGKTFNDDRKSNWFDQYFTLEKNITKCTLCKCKYKIRSPTLRSHSSRHKSAIDAGKDKQSKFFL